MFYGIGYPAAINTMLDISQEVHIKRAALECFASQLALRDYLRHMEALNVYRTYTLPESVRAAEDYLAETAGGLVQNPNVCYERSRLTDDLIPYPGIAGTKHGRSTIVLGKHVSVGAGL